MKHIADFLPFKTVKHVTLLNKETKAHAGSVTWVWGKTGSVTCNIILHEKEIPKLWENRKAKFNGVTHAKVNGSGYDKVTNSLQVCMLKNGLSVDVTDAKQFLEQFFEVIEAPFN